MIDSLLKLLTFIRRPRPCTFRRSESGQALVETAILMPVFVLLFIGATDFGRFTYDGIIVGNAAQAGAQYGAQTFNTAVNTTAIATAATTDGQAITMSAPAVQYSCWCTNTGATKTRADCFVTNPCTGTTHRIVFVQVTTSGTYTPIITYPSIPRTLPISWTAQRQVSP